MAYTNGGTRVARVSTAGAVIGLPVLASVPAVSGLSLDGVSGVGVEPHEQRVSSDLRPGTVARVADSSTSDQRGPVGGRTGGCACGRQNDDARRPVHPGRKVSRDLVSVQSLRYLRPDAECGRQRRGIAAADAAVKLRQLRRQLAGAQLVQRQVCRGDHHAAICCGRGARDTIGGAEISTAGVPSTAMRFVEADSGNRFFPEIAASSTNNRFLVSFNKSHATFYGQVLATGARRR